MIDASKERMRVEDVDPYKDSRPKREQVEEMFDSIAPAYDFMNTAMTFGLHHRWRDVALHGLLKFKPKRVLDVATGTGDVAFRLKELDNNIHITGIDLSEGMLAEAKKKLSSRPEYNGSMDFRYGDSLSLPFGDNEFDAITVAYGVRNFQNLEKGYKEMYRVLRPGGVICVIELSVPTNILLKCGYNIYSSHIIPMIGKFVSGDNRAYSYLPESIAACPQRHAMTKIMNRAGFKKAGWRSLTFGVVTIYMGRK